MAGWVMSVRSSKSLGPWLVTCQRSRPKASEASAKVSPTSGQAAANSANMPTDWDPCPGKMMAIDLLMEGFAAGTRGSETRQHRAPGEATAKAFHQDGLATLDAAIAHRRVEGQGDGGGGGIAMVGHGHHHLFHG